MTPGAPMSPFATSSAMTANGAISPSASSPTSCRRRNCPPGSTAAGWRPSFTSAPFPTPPRPTAVCGWSKCRFDTAAAERAGGGKRLPPQGAGMKFINVFGPKEYHKGAMMSVLARRFDDIKAGRPVQLFKSHREGIADGDKRRDFIYVDDVVRGMMWLLATPSISGIFNVGTGNARSLEDLVVS